MSWIYCNPNRRRSTAGDCVVRAIAIAENLTWLEAYDEICQQGRKEWEMPSANLVMGSYMYSHGYEKYLLPDQCPHCYTVRDFCIDNPVGKFILATGTHVVTVIDGDYYDAWDSGDETPIYFWH